MLKLCWRITRNVLLAFVGLFLIYKAYHVGTKSPEEPFYFLGPPVLLLLGALCFLAIFHEPVLPKFLVYFRRRKVVPVDEEISFQLDKLNTYADINHLLWSRADFTDAELRMLLEKIQHLRLKLEKEGLDEPVILITGNMPYGMTVTNSLLHHYLQDPEEQIKTRLKQGQ